MQFSLKNFVLENWRYLAGALAVILIGGVYFTRGQDVGPTLRVSVGDFVQKVSVSGTVVAAKDADLGFAASGRISGVYAKVGQQVYAGAILAETENGDLVAALSQAQAHLASLKAVTRPEEVAIASTAVTSATTALVNAVQSAYTTSDDAIHNKVDAFFTNPRTTPKLSFSISNMTLQTIVERERANIEPVLASWALLVAGLSPENVVEAASRSQTYLAQVITLLADANAALNQGTPDQTTTAATLSSYITTLATARTAVNTAASTLTASSASLDSAQKTLTLKQSGPTAETLAAEEAAVRSAQASLAKTRVIAPFTGVVTRMDAKVGEIVSPNVSNISMQSSGVFEVETYVPEVAIARIAPENTATVILDAYGGSTEFPATVILVDPAETIKDGIPTYKTTLVFHEADPRIRSGMTANVVIETGVLEDSIVIPAGAVGVQNGTSYVSVVEQNSVVSRPVTTGPSPAVGQAQILSGLSDGDVILLSPAR